MYDNCDETKKQLDMLSLKLFIGPKQIEQVNQHRVLGVTVDHVLRWLPHLENILKSVSRNLYLLSQLRHVADMESLLLFFYGHILPHINYASNIWDGCAEQHVKKLNSFHRRAIKLIDARKDIPTDKKMEDLGVLSLEKQLKLNKAVLTYKTVSGITPGYLRSLLCKQTERYDSLNLEPPLPRIDKYKSSFSYSGSELWNSIPKNIRTKPSVSSFKRSVKAYLFTN